jgi:hypothetical protein
MIFCEFLGELGRMADSPVTADFLLAEGLHMHHRVSASLKE